MDGRKERMEEKGMKYRGRGVNGKEKFMRWEL